MDHRRRQALAAIIEDDLPAMKRAVLDSWGDLMPRSLAWESSSRIRAEEAVEEALRGVVTVIAQGDVDEAFFVDTRSTVFAHGQATADEVGELLRTVRLVGLDLLLTKLTDHADLRADERWILQQEIHAFLESLHSIRGQVDASVVDRLLADLAAAPPDLA